MTHEQLREFAKLDFVWAADGRIYMRGRRKRERRQFVGLSVTPDELARVGRRTLLALAIRGDIALGNDGQVYVVWIMLSDAEEGRLVYEGYELLPEEPLYHEIHVMASMQAFGISQIVKTPRSGPE